jgi:hypothetical protein
MSDAGLIVAAVAIVIGLIAIIQVQGLRRRIDAVPADENVIELMQALNASANANTAEISRLQARLAEAEGRLPYALSYVGVVAYNAFGNITGRQSRSVALLNQRGDGLVITLLASREETVFFTKQVNGGVGVEELSPEESAAVDRALGR